MILDDEEAARLRDRDPDEDPDRLDECRQCGPATVVHDYDGVRLCSHCLEEHRERYPGAPFPMTRLEQEWEDA